MAKSHSVQLGDLCQDTVTEYQGIAVCVTEWMNGCRRIGLQSKALKDGVPVDVVVVDEHQLNVLASTTHTPDRKTGGPQDDKIALRR